MDNPLVSVIMGVYNVGNRFMLNRAVTSILNQTYTNIEFVICDDGSTDKTHEWLVSLAKSDSRIKLIRNKENKYLAATLNRCILESKGDYIARQDADDISMPERIEKQVEFLKEHTEFDFVGCNCSLYNDENGVFSERIMPEIPKKDDFLFNSPYIHGSMMFRRNCTCGKIRYAVTKLTTRTEDYEMFMRLYAKGAKGANIQENLYSFNMDPKIRGVKMKFRVDEALIRYRGFKKMGLFPKALPYVAKPIALGFIPRHLLNGLKRTFNRQ